MFKLKETTVSVRDQTIRVRELKHAERLQWVKLSQEDRFRGPALLVSLGSVEPKFSEEEAGELPSDVVDALVSNIMEISNLNKGGDKKQSKQTTAGTVAKVSDSSGDGEAAKPD